VAEETIDQLFLITAQRTVNKDCTVSLPSIFYEVPPAYIGKRFELKCAQKRPMDSDKRYYSHEE
jgi:hypothetical protein